MSEPARPRPAALVFGILLSRDVGLAGVLSRVAERFGRLQAVAAERPFRQSSYYDREMGEGVRRAYAAAADPVDPGRLAELKLEANALEGLWSDGGRRRVNLDPGLLSLTQLVLATGKPAGHRIYLGQGIYAEVEYLFESGSFQCLPWTYPDYREPDVVGFFNGLREGYRTGLKSSPLN